MTETVEESLLERFIFSDNPAEVVTQEEIRFLIENYWGTIETWLELEEEIGFLNEEHRRLIGLELKEQILTEVETKDWQEIGF